MIKIKNRKSNNNNNYYNHQASNKINNKTSKKKFNYQKSFPVKKYLTKNIMIN
jgi:hypothetical protein